MNNSNHYKKVVLDFETTGLDPSIDEILQVSAIDENGNTLINEYCKPVKITEWTEAENIHGISPSMVKDKKTFEKHIDKLSNILLNTDEIIIYNVEFELGFLGKYGVKFNDKVLFYDLMESFAIVYGDYNEYHQSYTWKSLETCCIYYGYNLKNAHDSLEDCRATLYCYNKLINSEGRYRALEHIEKTVGNFIDDVIPLSSEGNVRVSIYSEKDNDKDYFLGVITSKEGIDIKEVLECKIKNIEFVCFEYYILYVEDSVEVNYILANQKIEYWKNKYESKFNEYNDLKYKLTKLEKENLKLKTNLGLVEPKKISMINSYGFYTAEYCRETRKPMFKNSEEYKPFSDKLFSKTMCKKMKRPVAEDEEIYAFYRVKNGYCALYFRD